MDLQEYDELYLRPLTALSGSGSTIAVLEQPVLKTHPCYARNICKYFASSRNIFLPVPPQMHSSATLSIMVGRGREIPRLGMAPEANIHLYETNFFGPPPNRIRRTLLREVLLCLKMVKKEIERGTRYDALVFFCGLGPLPKEREVTQNILHVVSSIEKLGSTAVFHPAEKGSPFYGINEFGLPAWGMENLPKPAIGVPIGNRYLANYFNHGYYRDNKWSGICWVNAMLAGGFALCRQANPLLDKTSYYSLLMETSHVVDYGAGQRTQTISFKSAISALVS